MRMKSGFELRDICGEHIIVAYGAENVDFTKLITLNESAAFLWRQVADKDFQEEDLVQALCGEYEVGKEQALTDVRGLLASWRQVGIVE